jgi:hypothetical protein
MLIKIFKKKCHFVLYNMFSYLTKETRSPLSCTTFCCKYVYEKLFRYVHKQFMPLRKVVIKIFRSNWKLK